MSAINFDGGSREIFVEAAVKRYEFVLHRQAQIRATAEREATELNALQIEQKKLEACFNFPRDLPARAAEASA